MHYLKYVLVVYIWTEKGVVPPPMPDIHGELSAGETPLFSGTLGGVGRFSAAFRDNSVGRFNETCKTCIQKSLVNEVLKSVSEMARFIVITREYCKTDRVL